MTEVVIGLGILGFALLTLLSVCSIALRYHRQSLNHLNAARVNDMVLERAVASVMHDAPPGTTDTFWNNSYPYPNTPFRSGTEKVGRDSFSYAVYAVDVPGVGDPSADPPNILRRVDAYVWWKEEGEVGEKRTYCTRLINQGEEP